MKIICVIPARSGSKGIKNKNIQDLNGQPLISYPILNALQSKQIEEVYVSTDNKEIACEAIKYGAEVPFLRPKCYAKDDSPDMEWAKHFLSWFKLTKDYYPELIVHLRATTPIIDYKLIDIAIDTIKQHSEATALVSIEEISEIYKSFKYESIYLEPLFDLKYHLMPRQKCPKAYLPNGTVDILKVSTLLKSEFHGDKILGLIVPKFPEVDNKDDLEILRIKVEEKMINI